MKYLWFFFRDGSDEIDCQSLCKSNEFSCLNGRECISKKFECDGIFHCSDQSDEANCPDLNLRAYPYEQTIEEGREIVFQCRDEGPLRARVEWRRQSLPLPPGTKIQQTKIAVTKI